jgi:ubiquinone/menaquinone biosynthesis C-methylase UbiE
MENFPMAHTNGAVVHWAGRYDALIWLMTLGRERAFRERLAALAHLRPGESVLDVGCGTGSLAISAKRQVGPAGRVVGIDPSPEMIARAIRKAGKARLAVDFQEGIAEALPFADAQFDVVTNTVMLHHLPPSVRAQAIGEMRRVLKPGGRMLTVDFGQALQKRRGFIARLHGHGRVKFAGLVRLVQDAGFDVREHGDVGTKDLEFVIGIRP